MIEFPYSPDGNSGPDQPRPRRSLTWVLLAVGLLVVVIVVVVNRQRAAGPVTSNRLSTVPTSGPSGARPSGPSTAPSGGTAEPAVSCPEVRDEQSHLAYRCIENELSQVVGDSQLGLRISLQELTEPQWVISEGSGDIDAGPRSGTSVVVGPAPAVGAPRAPAGRPAGMRIPTADQTSPERVRAKVLARTAGAVELGYGDNPTSRSLRGTVRDFGGVSGYELLTEVTMDEAYRRSSGLHARTERLWVVGLPTPAGISVFMLTIPDDRKDLWPRAEATVGTVHVI